MFAVHDIDTALLRSFVSLAETRSFSRTAERVGRSQSAVSTQIRKLEDLVGCTLFDRDKRNVRLTREGEVLLGYARQMIRLSDTMLDRFRTPEIAGEVRFGSPEDFATRYLPEILAAFAAAHPRIRLDVNCDLTLHLIDGLKAGRYDLIVIKQDPDDLHADSIRLWREHLVWVGGPDLDPETPFAEVADGAASAPLPLVLSPPPCVYRARATRALAEIGLPWTVAYSSPSFAGAVAAVKAGLGFTVLPRTMVPEGLVGFDSRRGWPMLSDAEICLLSVPRPDPATAALAGFIRDRVQTYR